jgi:hypothetical protein
MPATFDLNNPLHGLTGKPYGTLQFSGGSGLAVTHSTAPFVSAYPWSENTGFGAKFANPATAVAGIGNGAVFNPTPNVLFIAHNTSPFVSAYAWNKLTGFGTKFANPGTLPNGDARAIALRRLASATSDHVALAAGLTVFVHAYTFSKSGAGWIAKFGNPATLPTGLSGGVSFHPLGASLAVGHSTSPFITAYPWSGSGFGVKYANPAVLAAANGQGVIFSGTGGAVSLAHTTNAGPSDISAWAFASGFGTKYADPLYPAGFFPNVGVATAINRIGNANVLGHDFNGAVGGFTGWDWDDTGGFGTRFNALAPIPAGRGSGSTWNETSRTFFGAIVPSPRIIARRWLVGGGFGTAYSDPATLPTGQGNGCAVAH